MKTVPAMGGAVFLAVLGGTLLGCPAAPVREPPGIGAQGGTLTSEDGHLTVVVPAGALTSPIDLTIALATQVPEGAVGPAYELGPSGTQFLAPVALAFTVDPSVVPEGTASLRVAAVEGGGWQALQLGVGDVATGSVTGLTTHFSTFGVNASARPLGRQSDPCACDPGCWDSACATASGTLAVTDEACGACTIVGVRDGGPRFLDEYEECSGTQTSFCTPAVRDCCTGSDGWLDGGSGSCWCSFVDDRAGADRALDCLEGLSAADASPADACEQGCPGRESIPPGSACAQSCQCTGVDVCAGGICQPGCVGGIPDVVPEDGACSDTCQCAGDATCVAGSCQRPPTPCTDDAGCPNQAFCDPATGTCAECGATCAESGCPEFQCVPFGNGCEQCDTSICIGAEDSIPLAGECRDGCECADNVPCESAPYPFDDRSVCCANPRDVGWLEPCTSDCDCVNSDSRCYPSDNRCH